jgi:uncharacterized protein YcfJ
MKPVYRTKQDEGTPWGTWLASIFGGAGGNAVGTSLLGSLFGGPIGGAVGGAVGSAVGSAATNAVGAGPSASVEVDPQATSAQWLEEQKQRRRMALNRVSQREWGGGYRA